MAAAWEIPPPADYLRNTSTGASDAACDGRQAGSKFGEVAEAVGLRSGERLEIDSHDGDIVIRRAAPHFTLEDLFRGKSPEARRALYAGAFDWGPDVGREVVED